MAQLTVANVPAASRYEARMDGELAGFADYLVAGHVIVFKHTEVLPEYEGQGVGGALARSALDDVKARGGLEVIPTCPFVAAWIGRHPDYVELVSPSLRGRFGRSTDTVVS